MNNWVEAVIFGLCILLMHLIALSTQALSGKQYFYGVYVRNIEIDENIKKDLHRKYKRRLNISFLIVILLFIVFGVIFDINPGLNIALLTIIYVAFMFFALKKCYDDVKVIKINYLLKHEEAKKKTIEIEALEIDEELETKKIKIKKKFTILFGICVCLSLISLLYVALNYSSLPDEIITHWGANGEPDGFSKKNFFNVFFVNIIDISMVLIFAGMGIGMISIRTYIDNKNIEANRKKAIKYLNGMGYSFLLLTLSTQAITTTIPIFMVKQSNIPIWLTISVCILPIFISVAVIYYYMMLRSLRPSKKDMLSLDDDDEKWIYGFIYYNKEDPAFMVEKRFGAGGSLNFGNPKGMAIGILLLVMTVGSLLLPFII